MSLPPETPILVVDDSASIRARMEDYLGKLGFRDVRSAASVDEGLATFRDQKSDLVFLDLVVDDRSGAEFAAEALKERPLSNIVVMTALPPGHQDVTTTIAEGARAFLPKPVRFDALQRVLEQLEDEPSGDVGERSARDASYI